VNRRYYITSATSRRCGFKLLQNDKGALERVDRVTVKALEPTAPRASTLDRKALLAKILRGEVFNSFSELEHARICERLPTIKGVIPSFFSFFRDCNYLQAYTSCLTWLLPPCSSGFSESSGSRHPKAARICHGQLHEYSEEV
jgi:hypothetical protein